MGIWCQNWVQAGWMHRLHRGSWSLLGRPHPNNPGRARWAHGYLRICLLTWDMSRDLCLGADISIYIPCTSTMQFLLQSRMYQHFFVSYHIVWWTLNYHHSGVISSLTRRSYSSTITLLLYLFYPLEAAFRASVTISIHKDLSILS